MAIKFTDYSITKAQAEELKGASVVPMEFRVKLLQKYVTDHGTDGLVELFSQFIGMANSVVENTREFIELYLITECNHTDRIAEKINLPTIFGALCGAGIAIPPTKGMCSSCAFRMGTAANQSPTTTCDAQWATETDCQFMCHEGKDATGKALMSGGEAVKPCVGYAKVHAKAFK